MRQDRNIWRQQLWIMAAITALVVIGCTNSMIARSTPSSVSETYPIFNQVLTPILATTQLRLGTQRVAFLLTTEQSIIKIPKATVTSTFHSDGTIKETKQALFNLWPYGLKGAYSTTLNFDQIGIWRLDISVEGSEGYLAGSIDIDVVDRLVIPDIGSRPPLSLNKTVRSTTHLMDATTDSTPDLDLYQMTIREAIATELPTVIVFAAPGFCTSPTCGPQVDTLSELKTLYWGKANFIHVELYNNPREIKAGFDRKVFHTLVGEWGFTEIPSWDNESWTFILNSDGQIAEKFEGFVTLSELEKALKEVISGIQHFKS